MLDSTSLPAHRGTINTEAQRRLATASRSRASQEARAWTEEHLTQDVPHAGDLRRAIASAGLQPPAWYVPGSDLLHLKRAARRLGWPKRRRVKALGCTGFATFAARFPGWPAWAVLGQEITEYQTFANVPPSRVQAAREGTGLEPGDPFRRGSAKEMQGLSNGAQAARGGRSRSCQEALQGHSRGDTACTVRACPWSTNASPAPHYGRTVRASVSIANASFFRRSCTPYFQRKKCQGALMGNLEPSHIELGHWYTGRMVTSQRRQNLALKIPIAARLQFVLFRKYSS